MSGEDIVLVAPRRTAIAKEAGMLRDVPPDRLAAKVIEATVRDAGIDSAAVDDVILGNQFGGSRVARHAGLYAGLPVSVPGLVVNRLCASSVEAVVLAAQKIRAGDASVVLAGGVESYTQAPYLLEKPRQAYQRRPPQFVSGSADRKSDPELGLSLSMGETAEVVAERYRVTREEQDEFALQSQRKAVRAAEDGVLRWATVPVETDGGVFEHDECLRPDTSMEGLSRLKPAFKRNGTVTAGNSCKRGDAAASILVTTAATAQRLGLAVVGRFVAACTVGVHPSIMGMGPVPAVGALLEKTGLSIERIGVMEFNEAFAAQSVAAIRELRIDPARVNVYGGAISHGHPSGATGAILITKLLTAMHSAKVQYGVVTLCIGSGMGMAALFSNQV